MSKKSLQSKDLQTKDAPPDQDSVLPIVESVGPDALAPPARMLFA